MNNRSIATIFTLLFLIASTDAHAINIRRWFQDAKYPTQQMVEKQSFTNPGAASSNGVISDNAGPTSAAAVTVTSGFTDPDVPRNLSIVPSGTTADVGACTITVSGTDFHGQAITEDFTFIANQTFPFTGLE